MTWEDIMDLTDEALLVALAEYCPTGTQLTAPDATSVSTRRPWNPLRDWRDTMALAWQSRVCLWAPGAAGHDPESGGADLGEVNILGHDGVSALHVSSETEARRAVCQLVLYVMTAQIRRLA